MSNNPSLNIYIRGPKSGLRERQMGHQELNIYHIRENPKTNIYICGINLVRLIITIINIIINTIFCYNKVEFHLYDSPFLGYETSFQYNIYNL